jgi:two-component system response regulator ArlR
MKVLIVDDDKFQQTHYQYIFEQEGYSCTKASSFFQAVELCENENFDLHFLDIHMPIKSGLDFAQHLKDTKGEENCFIFKTNFPDDETVVKGLEYKYSDFITTETQKGEILSRSKRVVNQLEGHQTKRSFLGLSLDITLNQLKSNDDLIHLSPIQTRLLDILMKAKTVPTTREKLVENIWGKDHFVDKNNFNTHLSLLRKILTDLDLEIKLQRGKGYVIQHI